MDFPLGGGSKQFTSGIGAASSGLTVTSSASADTMGSIVELDASTEEECCFLDVYTAAYGSSAVAISYLIDILIGGSGSEVLLVEGLHVSTDENVGLYDIQHWCCPLRIPKGSRISARCQSNNAAADSVDLLLRFTVPSFQSHPGFGQVVSLGNDTSNSASTIIVDPGTVAVNTKGAWVEIEASAQGYHGFFLSVGHNLVTSGQANANFLLDIGIGGAGSEVVLCPDLPFFTKSTESGHLPGSYIPVRIPEGVRLAARCQSTTDTSPRAKSLVFHGLR